MKLFFLGANKPLTKSYSLGHQGELIKTNYPNILNFTSHVETCNDLAQFHRVLTSHAKAGHCLLKGELHKRLIDEPRAGSTLSDDTTEWICLDFDKAPFKTVEEALTEIHKPNQVSPFADVSYVVQYSASHGLPGVTGLNCHVFIMLSHAYHAPYLKAWLMYLNMQCEALSEGITLSATNTHLSWPLDITTCQNDKLLFIAPPVLDGVKSSVKEAERYQLVIKRHKVLPVNLIATVDMNTMKAQAHTLKNDKREAAGMTKSRGQAKLDGDHYIVTSPGEAVITGGPWVTGEFTYFDLNNGDSRSYWHPNDNYEYIHCFKHPDEWLKTSALLPNYYKRKEAERKALNAAPTAQGEILLTFSDFKSSSYWRGKWNPGTFKMDLAQANNVSMLNDWRQAHGRDELEFVPIWDIKFDPHSTTIVDEKAKTVNTYLPNEYMRATYNRPGSLSRCPMIMKTIMHALNCDENDEILEHFLNWLAVIYQLRVKTRTVWVLSGNEGTGKGVIVNEVLKPTMGEAYVAHHDGAILEEVYNGWIENKLFISLNEVDITSSNLSKKIKQKLKHWITEPEMDIRNMYRGTYPSKSYCNLLMSTNETEPVHISDGDRRFNIGNFQPSKLMYTDKDIEAIRKERKAWMEYIMTRKADADYAGVILDTEARQRLIDVSMSSHEDMAKAIVNGDLMKFFEIVPNMSILVEIHGMNTGYASHFDSIVRREVVNLINHGKALDYSKTSTREQVLFKSLKLPKDSMYVDSKLSREELHSLFEYSVGNMPDTPAKFTKFLKHKGISVGTVKIDNHAVRGTYVTWAVTPAQYEELKDWLKPVLVSTTSTPTSTVKPKAKLKTA